VGKEQFWGFLMPIGFYGDCHYVRSAETYSICVRKDDKIFVHIVGDYFST